MAGVSPAGGAPGIGVAAVVWQDDSRQRILLGLGHNAQNRHELYAVPGGHWESGESLAEAVRRETLEEAGVEVKDLKLISVHEFFNTERQKSYVTIGFEAILAGGTPAVREPHNKTDWGWHPPADALALPLFPPDKVLIEHALSGVVYEFSA
jgi:8-oxo-dGTP diphosphatase